jgi:hypothetical protein
MSTLSPQAQAVMDATCKACPYISRSMAGSVAAAALCAAADQECPPRPGDYNAETFDEDWLVSDSIRRGFLAIAAELAAEAADVESDQ